MLWLILCILSGTGIFVLFKVIDKTNTPLINAIVINYLIASIIGFLFAGEFPVKNILNSDWLLLGITIGVLFIVMFLVVGISSNKAGLSITTVASKMSVVIPMLFAIFAYGEKTTILKIISIILAVCAVFMSVYKKTGDKKKMNFSTFLLPFILFIGMGLVDSLVIYSKEAYVDDSLASVFTATLFTFSFLSGLLYTLFRPSSLKDYLSGKAWLYGIMLGIVNFGSIYFVIRALNSDIFVNSVVYGINNICIVVLSVLIGTMFFREKLTKLNYLGVLLSILTIVFLTYAEI
ncbi:MAG: DMT family transporter [Bacteroidales bacterium]|jgi:drug/metabolite transporter (DMT)-like permease|nr:DMT family transporter [Bacteroidales bacterium]